MTTISAGAAAGLLVVLMVMSTNDGYGAELPAAEASNGLAHSGNINPPREMPRQPAAIGDGSVKPASR